MFCFLVMVVIGRLAGVVNFFMLNFVGEIIFIKMEASRPLLARAKAEVFHEFGGRITQPSWDWAIH